MKATDNVPSSSPLWIMVLAAWLTMLSPLLHAQDMSADVQLDVIKHRLVEAIKVENHQLTLKLIADARAMNRPLTPEFDFFEGNAFNALGKPDDAEAALKRYIEGAGPRARNYKPAIAMLSKLLEGKEARQAAARRAEEARQQREAAHAAMLAASVRVGEIKRINTEWGYAIVSIDAGADASAGPTLYALTPAGKRIDLKPGKLTGNELSATSVNAAALSPGIVVYQGPAANADPSAQAIAGLGSTAVKVISVTPGSRGAQSGLEANDVLLSVFVPAANREMKIASKAALMALTGRATTTSPISNSGSPNAGPAASGRLLAGLAAGTIGALGATPSPVPSPVASNQPMPVGISEFAADVHSGAGAPALTKSFIVTVLRNGSTVRLNGLNLEGVVLQDVSTAELATSR